MKAIIQCYTPEEVERIARGEQTIKVCKTAPKDTPFKVYIYQSKWHWVYKILPWLKERRGNVIGEFICNKVEKFIVGSLQSDDIEELACLSYTELINYFYKPCELDGNTAKQGYAWHISELKIYDKPKELREFIKVCPIKNRNCVGCEFYSDYSGSCTNYVTCPPRGWQYVEELSDD